MVEVTSSVEVDQGLKGNLGGNVGLGLSGRELFRSIVERVDVCVVVVFVVKLHDLAGDGRLESTIVIY